MAITANATTLTFSDATTQTTAGKTGTVTSVATGNGLSGGTITTTGTLSVACPTYGTVGSYIYAYFENGNPSSGSNYAGGTSTNQIASLNIAGDDFNNKRTTNPGGTWKWMAASSSSGGNSVGLACRVS